MSDEERVQALLELADERAPHFVELVNDAFVQSSKEREFQTRVDRLLAEFASEVGVDLLFHEEFTLLKSGRADSIYNRLIIEYEYPGSLRPNFDHGRTSHSIQQAKDYIEGLAAKEKHEKERLLGLCFDGRYLIFVRYREDDWTVEPALEWNEQSARRLLTSLVSLSNGRALTPENLVKDFGIKNVYSPRVTSALYEALNGHEDDLVDALYRQWKLFFSEVTEYEEVAPKLNQKKELKQFALAMGLDPNTLDLGHFLFSIHTYFSFLAKAIARLVLERYAGGSFGTTPLTVVANMDSQSLRRELEELEEGGIFRALGFVNLLEGDFFGWYLHAWTPKVSEAFQMTLDRLGQYNPATIEEDPYSARDLLKKLYHYLFPKELRHDLGEYYTPDWLATHVLNQLDEPAFVMPTGSEPTTPNLSVRMLDPACGSGTFLILAIRALKENGRRAGLAEADLLELITHQVVGLDLNPLAVLASRVGYVLAIADLVPYRRAPITVPVYLADSIVTPTEGMTLFEQGQRRLDTVVGKFPVPESVNSSDEIGLLADLLYEYVESSFETDAFVDRASKELGISEETFDHRTLRELYEMTFGLKKAGKDGVWARVLKNAFMPLFIGQFDYVAGNPPWIGWEHLPEGYRQQTSDLWTKLGLFVHSGMDTILGKGRKDLSTLMTYVALEKFLKPGGKLGFVITQSVFKGSGVGQGFRKFRLPSGTDLRVVSADDMSELQPFEGASNRTAVIVIEKGEATQYPVRYDYWRKTVKGKSIRYELSLKAVTEMTSRTQLEATPVDPSDSTSAWLTTGPGLSDVARKVIGPSDYVAHEGSNPGGGSAVYWLEVIEELSDGLLVRNRPELAKIKVPETMVELEPDLIFPLLRLGDLKRWKPSPSGHILMVQDPQARRGMNIDLLQRDFPRTYAYLKEFESFLRSRAAFKRYFTKPGPNGSIDTGPFYSMFNIGPYTFAPWKVVWGGIGSDVSAAVIEKDVVPQHTVTLVGVEDRLEAHYMCALLNSVPFRYGAIAYSQAGGKSFGTPHILENVRIPKYERDHEVHARLAMLSEQAHAAEETSSIEEEINQTSASVWGIQPDELSALEDAFNTIVKISSST